jgi:hypothetical protein
MSDLIVSYMVEGPNRVPFGYRFFEDGLVEDYRVSKHVKGASGTYTEQSVTPGWYKVVSLDSNGVHAVREAVQASGIYSISADIHGAPTSTDPRTATWRISVDGDERSIVIEPWPTTDSRVQALFQLTTQLTTLVTQALA